MSSLTWPTTVPATQNILDAWQGLLVKTELNAIFENIMPALYDDLGVAFYKYFGTDEQNWKTIDLLETARMVVAQAGSRFTVGLPLCMFIRFILFSWAGLAC
jgi:hypothetical protein